MTDNYTPQQGYCGECGKLCGIIWVDCGIGEYEYMGHKGSVTDLASLSDCCEAEVYDDKELTIMWEK